MPNGKPRESAAERIRHALWAGVIALALTISTLFLPFDQFVLVLQSRLVDFPASGQIAYVSTDEDLTDPEFPARRIRLAQALDALREAGVDRVYVDAAFEQPSTGPADRRLHQALRAFGPNANLVRNMSTGTNGELEVASNTPTIGADVPQVGSLHWRNYFGYVWEVPETVSDGREDLPAFHVSLAGKRLGRGDMTVNYGFRLSSIPTFDFDELDTAPGPMGSRRSLPTGLAGKTVVIGEPRTGANASLNIPGHIDVPASFVHIYAAETLMAGYTTVVQGWVIAAVAWLGLLLVGALRGSRLRHAGYALLAAAIPVAIVGAALLPVTTAFSGALALLAIYGGLRLRSIWRSQMRLVDSETGLPTFAALEADTVVAETAPAIIVARIHRFEEVRKSLPRDLHAEYMLRLVARLKAAKRDAEIYWGTGHMLAWTFPEKEPAMVREHLEGLRALFSAPLLVGDHQVDVGITFGVDVNPSANITRRLAGAVEAAERTTETYEPIAFAEAGTDEDLIWNISLQARIDAALTNGEIYMIYQPKVLVQTGQLVGVEALVRWRDPVKGLIPPDHFIRQCENAGRMSHLTRHVLTQACLAGNGFAEHGMPLPVAVNISSTLVHERLIVQMVREVLQDTGFDPGRLTLEITETYRISDFERAAGVLAELASLGPKISMDDFGVGAASLEALQRLPFGELKIDRMFTSAIKDDPKAAAIVANILKMGKDLRIIVVVEGVEDATTLAILRDMGCVVAQGFGISRPVSFDEILTFQNVMENDPLKKMV